MVAVRLLFLFLFLVFWQFWNLDLNFTSFLRLSLLPVFIRQK